MSDLRPSNSAVDGTAETLIRPTVTAIRIADGTVLADAAPLAEILTPVAKARRSREGEMFLYLFSPTGADLPGLCRELRGIVRRTYWSASGSVTASLRRSVSAANRYLFEHNLNADRSERCYGGLACAVLSDRDLFLLQAGPVWACILQGEQLRCFPRGERLAHIGIGPSADVRLHHVIAAPGDTLLLAPFTLLQDASEDGLRRVLSLGDVDGIAVGLEKIGSTDFAALVARWQPPSGRPAPQTQPVAQTRRQRGLSSPVRAPAGRREARKPVEERLRRADQGIPRQDVRAREQPLTRERDSFIKKVSLAIGRALKSSVQHLGSALSRMGHGFAAVGAGMLALGKWLLGAIAITIRSMLPGSRRTTDRHTRRHPPPEENRTVMVAIAAAIPIVILVVVLVAYRAFATESRLQGILGQAEEQIALAQAAEADSEEARAHWEQALERAEAAATLQPNEPAIQALRAQARQALDRLDRIERPVLTALVDFGSSNAGRRLVLHGRSLFVLDPQDGWAAQVPLDEVGRAATGSEDDGNLDQDRLPVLMHTGQQVDAEEIGPLIDATWVDRGEGRQSSALLVLAEDGQLVTYDPAWRSESGAPQLSLPELNASPLERPVAVGSFQGRFYVLDATAEGTGQIWRYRPEADTYPNQPERYFAASPPPHSLGQAIDMAIDGRIYVLYQDGHVEKFGGGERQAFEIRDVPGGLGEVSAFAVDPDGDGTVYVADRSNDRIVVLGPDGHFQSQLRTDPPLTSLEALAVSQADRTVYVLAAGQVYEAVLP